MTYKVNPLMVRCFVAMVTYNLDHNINVFVCVNQMLTCKYVHLIFCHKKFCSENGVSGAFKTV